MFVLPEASASGRKRSIHRALSLSPDRINMSFNSSQFRITSGASFRLKDHPTELKEHFDKDELKEMLEDDKRAITKQQELLYAEGNARC